LNSAGAVSRAAVYASMMTFGARISAAWPTVS
jgi:hypothetical protein